MDVDDDDDERRHRQPLRPTAVSADGFVVIYALLGEFHWTCPECHRRYRGLLAARPVSGWNNPRWVVLPGPGLLPSLMCSGLRDTSCRGHWWLRDGRLEAA